MRRDLLLGDRGAVTRRSPASSQLGALGLTDQATQSLLEEGSVPVRVSHGKVDDLADCLLDLDGGRTRCRLIVGVARRFDIGLLSRMPGRAVEH